MTEDERKRLIERLRAKAAVAESHMPNVSSLLAQAAEALGKEGDSPSNASRAATGPVARIATEAEPAAAFTPGPWRAMNDHSVKSYAPGHWAVIGPCGGRRREANARLIAAAPDLLEALIECEDQLAVLARHANTNPWVLKARTAIAKALASSPPAGEAS